MSSYVVITTNGELYHHGIKGQKWGVRHDHYPLSPSEHTSSERKSGWQKSLDKFDKKIAKAESKASGAKTRIGKRYQIIKSEQLQYEKARKENIHNAKGLGKKMSEALGYGEMSTRYNANAKLQKRLAEVAKTEKQRNKLNIASYNSQQLSKYADVMKNAKTSKKVAEAYFHGELRKVKVKSLAGRDTTIGKEAVLRMLGGGTTILNKAADARYKIKQKKIEKANSND